MRKLIICIAVASAILLLGSYYEQAFVLDSFNDFKGEISTLIEKANDETLNENELIKTQKEWDKKRKYLHVFIPHTEIKEIGLWLSEAIAYAKENNYEEVKDKLKVIYDLSISIPENFRIKIENIL